MEGHALALKHDYVALGANLLADDFPGPRRDDRACILAGEIEHSTHANATVFV